MKMEYIHGLSQGVPIARDYPILAAADAVKGTLFMAGATPGTNGGCAILGAGTVPDAIGLLAEDYDFSVEGSSSVSSGTNIMKPFEISPLGVLRAGYDTSDTAAATDAEADTTISCTSLENNIDGGYLYIYSGTAIGQLRVITVSGSGTCEIKTAFSPALAVSDTFLKILPRGHQVLKINAAATGIGTDVGAGSMTVRVLDIHYQTIGTAGVEKLNATKHSGLNNLDTLTPLFFTDFVLTNHSYNPTD